MFRKIAPLLLLFTGLSVFASAQNFEGMIEFKKVTGKEIVNYVYYVKGDKVRIDELSPGTRNVSGTFIVNTKDSTMRYLVPDRKLWGTRSKPQTRPAAPAGCIVSTTKNTQVLFGYKCSEQVVRNDKDTTQISFFIAPGKFTFFMPMMKLLNRQDRFYTYYFALAPKEGSMPLLAVEKNLKGEERSRLEVTLLAQKSLAEGLFDIPKDYTEIK